ncbi:FAD-dependent monooxygenase, partial [Frankia sp. AgPm24]|uniref:FAD-dependent monooxygenase n=1 Tax=Frankia sp. AgPm24 TaxID=631128 RepID=UPI0020108E1B
MSSATSVLIVGAGPCGLALAAVLTRLGTSVRVIDAADAAGTGSRAILLWPPALEVLDDLGVLDEARQLGFAPHAMNYYLTGRRTVRIGLDPRNRPLVLPQEHTSRLLSKALTEQGVAVEWSTRATDLTVSEHGVVVEVTRPAGTETITADWLIGADGVGSAVRQRLGIEFPGGDVPLTVLLAEGIVDGGFARDELHYHFGQAGPLLCAPLPGGLVRLASPLAPDTALSTELVQRLVDLRGPGGLTVGALGTLTTFTSQERIAATLRLRRAFLIGDAAHTHSPIGGQGLNLGLSDVRNLGWKLAGVVQGRLAESVLDTYDPERRQAAEQTVQTAARLIRLAVLRGAKARVRNAGWDVLQRTGSLRRWYAPLLAGWRTRYPLLLGEPEPAGALSPGGLLRGRGLGGRGLGGRGLGGRGLGRASRRGLPPAGARTPAWIPAAGPIRSATAAGRLRLVTRGPAAPTRPDGSTGQVADSLVGAARAVTDRFPSLVSHEHVADGPAGFVLLRPDGYVSASGSRAAELAEVERLLTVLSPTPRAQAPTTEAGSGSATSSSGSAASSGEPVSAPQDTPRRPAVPAARGPRSRGAGPVGGPP